MDGQNLYDQDEDGLYDFTEDQIQAMLELDLLQREAIECSGTSLLAITYDIKARLEEVNRALAEDPTPMESNRNIRVAFKSEIVDLIVPPEEIPSDEEYEAEDEHDATNTSVDIPQNEDSDEETARFDPAECEEAALAPAKNEEELDVDEEAEKDLLDDSPLLSTDDSSVDQTTINFSLEDEGAKLPNDKAVQSTEVDFEREKDQKNARGPKRLRRPKQSKPGLNYKGDDENSHSTFVSGSDCSQTRRTKSAKGKGEEEEEEERKRKEAADLAFQSWLRHKRRKAREQRRREKKENEEKNKNKEPPVDTSAAIKDYWRRKRREARQKQKESSRQKEELRRQEELRLRSRQEVEMAYQKWVKQKKQQARQAQDEEQRRQMITKLSLRTSRRSQALALALNTAGRFIDYYGYR